jgi:hypothetical protein
MPKAYKHAQEQQTQEFPSFQPHTFRPYTTMNINKNEFNSCLGNSDFLRTERRSLILESGEDISLRHNAQTDTWVDPADHSVGTKSIFTRGKLAESEAEYSPPFVSKLKAHESLPTFIISLYLFFTAGD